MYQPKSFYQNTTEEWRSGPSIHKRSFMLEFSPLFLSLENWGALIRSTSSQKGLQRTYMYQNRKLFVLKVTFLAVSVQFHEFKCIYDMFFQLAMLRAENYIRDYNALWSYYRVFLKILHFKNIKVPIQNWPYFN